MVKKRLTDQKTFFTPVGHDTWGMVDRVSKEVRSRIMSSIRGKNTTPEIKIRKLLWANGKRYRIHDGTVVGCPDISNKSKGLAVFIDGCFWHGCGRCYREPKTNTVFWRDKIAANKRRRRSVSRKLRNGGTTVLQFWEHEVNSNPERVARLISEYL